MRNISVEQTITQMGISALELADGRPDLQHEAAQISTIISLTKASMERNRISFPEVLEILNSVGKRINDLASNPPTE